MRKRATRTVLLALLCLPGSCAAPLEKLNTEGLRYPLLILEPVSLVDLQAQEPVVRRNWRLIIRDGSILYVGPAGSFPAQRNPAFDFSGATVLDLNNRYLVPGLADGHVHISDENDLLLFLANGVTTVRSMGESTGMGRWLGFPVVRSLKARVASGAIPGPRIYGAGPILEGVPQTSPAMTKLETVQDAEAEARAQALQSYDLLKIYDHLTAEQYAAIVRVSRETGVPFGGHVPFSVDVDRTIHDGMRSIEHLSGWVDNDRIVFRVPRARWQDLADLARSRGVYHVPTIVTFDRIVPLERFEEVVHTPEEKYLSWIMRFWWYKSLEAVLENANQPGPNYAASVRSMLLELTRFLHERGVPIVAGTDASFVGVYPGFSLHDELKRLNEAGLTPGEVLRTATKNSAAMMNASGQWGCVAVGCSADLVILEQNPLNDISATRSIYGVFARGIFYDRAALDRILRAAER